MARLKKAYRAWLLFCPIYMCETDAMWIEGGPAPAILPRPRWLGWWLEVTIWCELATGWLALQLYDDYAGFPIWVGSEVTDQKTLEYLQEQVRDIE